MSIDSNGYQVFNIPNTKKGNQFLELSREFLNKDVYKIRPRGRGSRKQAGNKAYVPLKYSEWYALYVEEKNPKKELENYYQKESQIFKNKLAKAEETILELNKEYQELLTKHWNLQQEHDDLLQKLWNVETGGVFPTAFTNSLSKAKTLKLQALTVWDDFKHWTKDKYQDVKSYPYKDKCNKLKQGFNSKVLTHFRGD